MSVIIVNDDATQLAVLSELVKKQGLETHGFSSAESALRAMDPKRPPKLVVSDLCMPGIDGWRFCRLLRSPEFPAYNAVPILVVSATFAGDDAARIAADTGADAFLPSPVDGERFVGAVRNLLAGEAVRHRPRVLIVEDSRSLAETLKTAFENRGYRADVALEGRGGISAFAGQTFDAAAIDYHLPDGPGDSLLRGFRARNPDCVCVMMTSDPRPELALEWMKSGAAAYARKPFTPEYLVELCDRARRERSLLRVEELLERRTRQLRSNEALSKTVLDALHEAVHIVGPDLRVLMANRRFREWFEELGLSADVLGRPLREIAPFLSEKVFAQYRRVFETKEPLFTEAENEVAGKRFFTETRKLPIPGPGGGPAVLTVISDVSRRREAEARLRRNNEEQALLLDAIPTQVWYLTDVETYGRVNRAHAEFLGRSKGDMEHGKLGEMFPEEEAEACRDGNRQVFQTRKPVHTEEWMETPDRGRRLLRIVKTPIFDENGAVRFVVCAATDATEQFRCEIGIRKEKERLEQVIEATRAGIWEWWIPTDEARFSERWAEISGYTLEELGPTRIGTWREFCHPDDLRKSEERLREHFSGEREFYECKCRVRHKSGGWVWVRDHGKVVERDETGAPLRMIGTHIDITRDKEMERERQRFEQRRYRLEKAESLERMAGAIAHHYNNILFGVLGNLEMAMDEIPPSEPFRRYLEDAMTATQRAADLASRMLVYLGQTRERPQSLDLSETCREFLAMFRSRLPAGIVPKADLPAAGPRIRGKPEHLRQLLENLIGNAAEAMENRTGEIRIRLTIRPGWRIARQRMFPAGFRPDPARRYAKLEISDAGAGIPAANLERMFDPFFSTRFVGRGLGLAMVQGIVKAMNGGIAVDSKEGVGSRFRVYLPAEDDESSGNENENPTPEDAPPA